MRRGSYNIASRNTLAVCTAMVMILGLIATTSSSVNGKPRPQVQTCEGQTCITVKSGNGNESDCDNNVINRDSQVLFSTDGGVTFNPTDTAFIVVPNNDKCCHYDVLPGTHYISSSCSRVAEQMAHHFFKATFSLPAGFVTPCLSIKVHSDNATAVSLNGNLIGTQNDEENIANFQDPADVFTTNTVGFFNAGVNSLTFDVHNFTNEMALDFEATICYSLGCIDQNPPAISCNVTESTLWPPNHDLENVGLTATVTDDCDSHVVIGGGPNGTGVTVYSDEPDLDILGSGNFSPDAKNINLGTLRLRSERSGNENGRVYLIVVQATDMAGHTGYCTNTVTVTHDQSKKSTDSVAAQAAAAAAYFNTNHTPPPGFVQVGIGPIVGPKQ
jgi:hypothetical protein